MPKLVDYAGRYEFLRQAAFAVVRDQSVEALTRRAIAAELGCGVNTVRRLVDTWVHPVRLAADEVVTRRHRGRMGRRSEDPLEVVHYLIRSVMPEDDLHLDDELVWLKLIAACALRPSGLEEPGKSRRDFQIGQRGYADDDLDDEDRAYWAQLRGGEDAQDAADPASDQASDQASDRPSDRPSDRVPARIPEDRRTALESFVVQRDEVLRGCVDRVLLLLEVPEPREVVATLLIAVIEGLTLSACLGRLRPEEATELAVQYALTLGP